MKKLTQSIVGTIFILFVLALLIGFPEYAIRPRLAPPTQQDFNHAAVLTTASLLTSVGATQDIDDLFILNLLVNMNYGRCREFQYGDEIRECRGQIPIGAVAEVRALLPKEVQYHNED